MKKEVTVGSGSVDRLDVKVEQCDLFSFVVVEHADTAVVELVGPRSTSIGTPNAATRLAFPDAIERPRAVAPSHCDHAKIVIAEVSQTAPAAGFGEDDFYPRLRGQGSSARRPTGSEPSAAGRQQEGGVSATNRC